MTSLSSPSASRCSSSSFHRSSRYSTSTVRSFSSDALQPRLHSQFGEETSINSITNGFEPEQESFTCYHGDSQDESSWNESFGGYQVPGSGRPARMGVVSAVGDRYFLSADVSGFEPQEVVVLAYNQCVVIHAEKMGADGSVAGKFTHKSQLPADMDPLSVSNTLTAEGMLVISVGRVPNLSAKSLTPVFHSETHL
ncbi:heat shock protein beta-7-like [Myxocyprinus asiaticus]|uniref:heat shock protein beta-7-like n=1 Tax=Myxocyprinus asiaticus TaxID=70543 RepID=UPI0022216862|nr:heat shock protein beta-7-like [Myxocyprinus asiaticus]